jgi:hypothetical protein
MSKDAYMEAHEQLVEEYLEENPDATWDEAYEATADGAWDRSRDNFFDRVDYYRQQRKDAGI